MMALRAAGLWPAIFRPLFVCAFGAERPAGGLLSGPTFDLSKVNYVMPNYSEKSQEKVEETMREMKEGKLTSGRSGKKVTNPRQAIAIGLSEARKEGDKVPKTPVGRATKKTASKTDPKKAVKKGAKKGAKKAAAGKA